MRSRPTLFSASSTFLYGLAILFAFGLLGCGQSATESSQETGLADDVAIDRGTELSKRFLLIDTHIDVPYRLHKGWEDVSVATQGGDFDYPRAVAGGLDSMFMSIYIPADVDTAGEAKGFAEGLIDSVEALAANAPDKFGIATCTADVLALKVAGKISMPLGMENGGPIEGSFDNLSHFADRGIRYITLAHSKSNHISDSSYDLNEHWQGLSEFGKTLIPEMNRQGVMIDISHVSDKAFWQVLELTDVPVIASHSSLRHYTPGFQRNMSDEMVTALGENGGVIQINFGSSFLTKASRDYSNASQQAKIRFRAQATENLDEEKLAAFDANYRQENPYPYATVEDVLDHIDRAVELAGIDHVGIGSDYDGVGDSLPVGLKDVGEYPNLVTGLLERGYSEEDIEKIWGGNTLRVWAAAEAYATAAGQPPVCSQER
jgi:membrane dipeptidase